LPAPRTLRAARTGPPTTTERTVAVAEVSRTTVVGVQSQEPNLGSTPQPPAARAPVSGSPSADGTVPQTLTAVQVGGLGKTRNRKMRLWLAIGAGVVALLCLGGVGVAVSLYDNATKIDRASPDQVTSSFLRAYLVNRNDKDASLFICKSGAQLNSIAALRADMISRERRFGTVVGTSWESLTVADSSNGTKSVIVDLAISGSLQGRQVSSHSERWSFRLVDSDGWRVCSAAKLS
jgi:hypothetical protein